MTSLRTPDERFKNLPGFAYAPHYLEIGENRIHYVDEGPRAADPILLMRWPARIPAGTVYHSPVSLMDIYPTVAAATGARLPDGETLDGVNLIPHIHGEKTAPPHDALVWRSGEYKAIWYGDYRLQIDGYQDKTVLYNIAKDNGERNNLASAEPIVAQKLTAALNEFTATFAEPRWEIPFVVPQPVDIWPGERPPDAETMYFGG